MTSFATWRERASTPRQRQEEPPSCGPARAPRKMVQSLQTTWAHRRSLEAGRVDSGGRCFPICPGHLTRVEAAQTSASLSRLPRGWVPGRSCPSSPCTPPPGQTLHPPPSQKSGLSRPGGRGLVERADSHLESRPGGARNKPQMSVLCTHGRAVLPNSHSRRHCPNKLRPGCFSNCSPRPGRAGKQQEMVRRQPSQVGGRLAGHGFWCPSLRLLDPPSM